MIIKFLMKNLGLIKTIETEIQVTENDNMQYLLIKRKDNALIFSCSATTTMQNRVILNDVEFDEDGDIEFSIDRNIFINALNSMIREEYISMKLMDNNRLFIYNKNKKISHKIAIFDNKYNDLKIENNKYNKIMVNTKDFFLKINRVGISIAINDNRKYLLGICLDVVSNKKMNMASSDGTRLSIDSIDIELDGDESRTKVVVPVGFFKLLEKYANVISAEKITIGIINENVIISDLGVAIIISPLFEGNFIDYFSILDGIKNEKSFEINSSQMFSLIKNTNIQKSITGKNIFSIKGNNITVRSQEQTTESAIEEEIIKSDADVDFACMYKFVTEYITANKDIETLKFFFNEKNSSKIPMLLKKDDYTYILMPMKI